ncbi:hypothetical protein BJV78DRAFT_458292 [Lactifluus subvellereus]|nr:hypothetical protein BJV78DRAFT_458292 [Lactifluus subvellereus]
MPTTVGGSLPSNPAARTGYLLYSVHIHAHVPSNGKPSRSLEHLSSVSTDLWLPEPVLTGRLSLHLLHYGILIRFQFSMWVNLSQGDGVEEFCSKDSRSFPSIQENLRFSRVPSISWAPAPDKVQSCFADPLLYLYGWSVTMPSNSNLLRAHGVCHHTCLCFLSQSVARTHYLYFNSL